MVPARFESMPCPGPETQGTPLVADILGTGIVDKRVVAPALPRPDSGPGKRTAANRATPSESRFSECAERKLRGFTIPCVGHRVVV
jgi:hypothetical protein